MGFGEGLVPCDAHLPEPARQRRAVALEKGRQGLDAQDLGRERDALLGAARELPERSEVEQRDRHGLRLHCPPMLSFDEARSRLLASVPRVGVERVPLALASGRVLAQDARSYEQVPAFDGSAMDGYALALASLVGDGPWRLPVVGESRTGHPAPPLAPGTACRIFTGAVVPQGADAVVMQENVEREGDVASFRERPRKGAHVRPAGQDLAAGELALPAGTRLGPAHLSLLAMLERVEARVARRPVVTILATGDELRAPGARSGDPGGPARAGMVAESNGVGLAAMAAQAGAVAHVLPVVGDDAEATERAITEALRTTDLLLTVGGVSVGDHDLVRPALERAGVSLEFWKVAIKPGKPLAFGRSERALVLGLPGNPVSALVTFSLFGMPLLRAMQGDLSPIAPPLRGRLAKRLERAPGRLEFMRAQLSWGAAGLTVFPLGNQASGAVVALARGDALAVVPAEVSALDEGAEVEVLRLADM
jgi:molybdopterin molybdotransferase